MRGSKKWLVSATLAGVAIIVAACAGMVGGGNYMTFFVTSAGMGKGADLGGLAGADAHCQKLAASVGGSGKTWRAYLSTQGKDGAPTVNARDRIGRGPWQNAKGTFVANSVDDLHGGSNNVGRIQV